MLPYFSVKILFMVPTIYVLSMNKQHNDSPFIQCSVQQDNQSTTETCLIEKIGHGVRKPVFGLKSVYAATETS